MALKRSTLQALGLAYDPSDGVAQENFANQYNQMLAQQAQLGHAQGVQNYNPNPTPPSVHATALSMLKMRLGGVDNTFQLNPDEMLLCHVADDTVYIFFVLKGKGGYLQDEVSLFPSDKLVTQFRLIR
jgi:hypothetical protein